MAATSAVLGRRRVEPSVASKRHPCQRLAGEYLPEAVQFILEGTLAQIQEQADEVGQGQGPLAGEVPGAEAGAVGKLGGRQEFLYGRIELFKFAQLVARRLGSAGSLWV